MSTAGSRPVITAALVRELVDAQFPQWAGLPLRPVEPGGSDHVIYRLGGELSMRLPRHADARGQAEKESTWPPRPAPHLPLAVPVPVGVGDTSSRRENPPSEELRGELSAEEPRDGLVARPLAGRDRATRAAIRQVGDVFDRAALTRLWDAALSAPAWDRPPVWSHGDFHTGNLLTRGGRLSALTDFGELGVGDPARDLMIAFTLLSARSRAAFRDALGVDDATWTRGRGWALATA
ncbi:aminoglycoside phosphotransferase family protein [Nonomuraea composti]|uniref:aminoglycoside phosphotransferase family protein n=1 Tax=Nonomuraea composti TaxID=2720023 RepID=UPI001F0D31EF|nr:aminoglycoside phosphotransferase family protein [Nonomuraea sp. FMUSA5-5]